MTREEIAQQILEGSVPERYVMKGYTVKDVVLNPCIGATTMEGLYIAYKGKGSNKRDTVWRPVLTEEEYEWRHRQLEKTAEQYMKAVIANEKQSQKH